MAEYTMEQLSQIFSQARAYVQSEFDIALRHGDLEAFMEKYDISLSGVQPQIVTRDMKILVVGDLSGRESDYVKAAKEFGLTENNLEFVDFNQIKTFNIAQLKYSFKYSDIICGPIPHSINKLHGSNSLISLLENAEDKEAYPKLIKAIPKQQNGSLKLTISVFRKILPETRLVREMMGL